LKIEDQKLKIIQLHCLIFLLLILNFSAQSEPLCRSGKPIPICIGINCSTQNDSLNFFTPSKQFNPRRFKGVVISEGLLSSLSLIALNNLWYSNFPRSSFHFINDNDEWLQIDKVGHAVSAYYTGKVGMDLLKWSGVERKKAIGYGGSLGFMFLTAVEILDGFPVEWGFSAGDLVANMLGSALLIGQEFGWNEQRIVLKYSFHKTTIAKYRPQLLGSNLAENLLKDYNGQTYWISANIHSFLHKESRFPKWLNISFGYGAYGMTGGSSNPTDVDGKPIPYFERFRQHYLSLDIDLTRISTRSKLLKTCFSTFGFIKVPFPTLEYNRVDGIVFHPFYF